MLIYQCPKTGKLVDTSIETTANEVRRLASFKLSLWCPHCQSPHIVFGKDISVSSTKLTAAA
jgi:hypothetical protein